MCRSLDFKDALGTRREVRLPVEACWGTREYSFRQFVADPVSIEAESASKTAGTRLAQLEDTLPARPKLPKTATRASWREKRPRTACPGPCEPLFFLAYWTCATIAMLVEVV